MHNTEENNILNKSHILGGYAILPSSSLVVVFFFLFSLLFVLSEGRSRGFPSLEQESYYEYWPRPNLGV